MWQARAGKTAAAKGIGHGGASSPEVQKRGRYEERACVCMCEIVCVCVCVCMCVCVSRVEGGDL